MKKIFTLIIVCVLLCCLGTAAVADNEYATAWDMLQSWYMEADGGNAYPEGVCGVWSTDGSTENLCIAVTGDEAGESVKADILAAVADETGLSFDTQKYSYAQLWEVNGKIGEYVTSYEGEELGVAGWGVYEMQNKVHVDIILSKPGAEDFMRWGYENFGDMIMFESVDGYAVPTAEELSTGEGGGGIAGVIVAALAVAAIICAVLIARKRMFGKAKEESAE